MTLLTLARGSLANRRASVALAVATIAIAVGLLVLVEQMRGQVREGFYRSVSGTDLIVGAPTSPVQLLLFSVFGIGNPSRNVAWQTYSEVAANPMVEWAVPLSLGDSWRGFRVVATTGAMFEHYRYAGGQALEFAAGGTFVEPFDIVAGARAAYEAGLAVGDELVLAHGGGNVSLNRHDALPFTVSGILAPTGTPVDRALYIGLDAQQAIHVGWERGVPEPGRTLTREQARALALGDGHDETGDDHEHAGDLTGNHAAAGESAGPEISAFLLGLRTRAAALGLQYRINQRAGEPLLAILPGLALQQLWRITELAEQILRVVSALVVLAGLLGMLTALLATLGERRREMAILRACGARPWQIAWLLLLEAGAIALIGIVTGLAVADLAQWALAPWLLERFGVAVSFAWPAPWQWAVLAAIWIAGVLVALVPAAMAYRRTVADGMQVRQ